MDPTQIPGLSGWPSLIITAFTLILYGIYTNKSVKSKVANAKKESEEKAEDIAKNANRDAIETMQVHIGILRERVKDAEQENVKLRQLFDTISSALKSRGLYISIDGDMIHLHDTKGDSITVHIDKQTDKS